MYCIGDNERCVIQVGETPNPVLILRTPTRQELKAFLSSRWEHRRNKMEDRTVEARERFIDALLIDVENVAVRVGDQAVPLTKDMADWKSRIPVNWKTSLAIRFEEQETLTGDDEKNSGRPSGS